MSALLCIVGAIAFVIGVGMVGFGIPINEFSFGNTLIIAGTSATAGGLVVFGLGAVVAQLQRIAESQAMWTPARSEHTAEMFEAPAAARAVPAGARVPFPPRPAAKTVEPETEAPKEPEIESHSAPEPVLSAAPPVEAPLEDRFSAPPALHNPDIPPVETGEEVSLSPGEPQDAPETAWRPSPPPPPEVAPAPAAPADTSHFDAMWPAFEPKPARQPAFDDDQGDPMLDLPPARESADPAATEEPPRAVAILKSGVVDGMGYTLYVDGSIEAELPQGTLRFSSINDLRGYLEKNA